jgi:saccharopine dehydrogenase (NAD+, L-lysine-forming)
MPPHVWIRAEQRANEERVGLTPEGAATLIDAGIRVSVECSTSRAIPIALYEGVSGVEVVAENSWPSAPADAIIFGLKELPDDGSPLTHRHIMFGHAFKGQSAGALLLSRFKAGGGTLYDLEYLTDELGRRVAAFGYWAGFAGAALAVKCWAAQLRGAQLGAVRKSDSKAALLDELGHEMPLDGRRPRVIIIGALGRVGRGAADLCSALGISHITKWDMEETSSGGPFPEIVADHDIFLNCILASPGCPVFVPADAATDGARALRVIGDIACDPGSDFNPVRVYDRVTSWDEPSLRVADDPPLDVIAIDNLPSMLPVESSSDYASQLLPSLLELHTEAGKDGAVWGRAAAIFRDHVSKL